MKNKFYTTRRHYFKAASAFAVVLSALSFVLPAQFNSAQAETAKSDLPKHVVAA